ncbi:MAG TPA: hypothetical protein VNT01_07055 [Symbiobacteriaceae bacterium]|nr:hypothetical protein [Symbiobacteriaceae bacterium]
MSCVFSSRNPRPIICDQPELTINFPVAAVPGSTVTLANGAVVDLEQLGRIIAQHCPLFVCASNVVQSTQVVQTAPVRAGLTHM